MGKPLSAHDAVRSITDSEGNFYKYNGLVKNLSNLNMEEVKTEWRAQIEAFIKAADKKPDHLDSHHHSSYFSPDLFRGMLELAKEYDCPIRFPFTGDISGELKNTHPHVPELMEEFHPRHPDVFLVDFYDKQATQDALTELLLNLNDGSTELMCHVGFVPDAFVKESSYNKARQKELGILLNPTVKQMMDGVGIELINFSQL